MPLQVAAANLGHASVKMIEAHYGHLSPGYVTETVRKHAPRFGNAGSGKIVPLR
jgi:hypothetical protein